MQVALVRATLIETLRIKHKDVDKYWTQMNRDFKELNQRLEFGLNILCKYFENRFLQCKIKPRTINYSSEFHIEGRFIHCIIFFIYLVEVTQRT